MGTRSQLTCRKQAGKLLCSQTTGTCVVPLPLLTWTSGMPPGPPRTALYRRMSSLVATYAPWILRLNGYRNVVAQPWLKGYKQSAYREHLWKYYDVAR